MAPISKLLQGQKKGHRIEPIFSLSPWADWAEGERERKQPGSARSAVRVHASPGELEQAVQSPVKAAEKPAGVMGDLAEASPGLRWRGRERDQAGKSDGDRDSPDALRHEKPPSRAGHPGEPPRLPVPGSIQKVLERASK